MLLYIGLPVPAPTTGLSEKAVFNIREREFRAEKNEKDGVIRRRNLRA